MFTANLIKQKKTKSQYRKLKKNLTKIYKKKPLFSNFLFKVCGIIIFCAQILVKSLKRAAKDEKLSRKPVERSFEKKRYNNI